MAVRTEEFDRLRATSWSRNSPADRTVFASMAETPGLRSPGELEITRSTSAVAVCCSSDSRNSLKSRAFSMAMTASVGEALQQLQFVRCEGPQHVGKRSARR